MSWVTVNLIILDLIVGTWATACLILATAAVLGSKKISRGEPTLSEDGIAERDEAQPCPPEFLQRTTDNGQRTGSLDPRHLPELSGQRR